MLKTNQLKRVEVKEFEIENQIIFNSLDKLSASERDDANLMIETYKIDGWEDEEIGMLLFENIMNDNL